VLVAYTAVTSLRRGWSTGLKGGLVILVGAAPLVLVVLLFKAQVGTSNDLLARQGLVESTARMFDPTRHLAIVTAFLTEGIQLIQGFAVAIPLAFALLGRRRVPADGSFTLAAAVIGLMVTAYYMAYLVTPYDVSWHMATSLDRLLLQLWPMTVFAVFLQLRSPEEALFIRQTERSGGTLEPACEGHRPSQTQEPYQVATHRPRWPDRRSISTPTASGSTL
jgi:hypothetical protein